jgi:uncharacterized membrane protein YqjE
MPAVRGDANRGLGVLLRDLADGSRRLVRQEIRLARLELDRVLHGATSATVRIALGGVLAILGVIALVTGIILLIGAEGLSSRYWLAALIVTAFLAIVAMVIALRARARLAPARLEPDETLQTLKEDREWLRRQLTSGATSS